MTDLDRDLLLSELTLIGPVSRAEVVEAIVEAPVVRRTLDGASTLDVTLSDYSRRLLRSGMFGTRSWATVAGLGYELVSVRKSGDRLTLTLEDAIAAALRRRTAPLTAPAGSTTRAEFLRRLAGEAQVPVMVDPAPRGVATEALTRNADGQGGSSWEATGEVCEAAGWRRFTDGHRLLCGSDDWLAGLNPPWRVAEFAGPVHTIDLDLDTGQPAATATVEVDAARWSALPGHRVEVAGMGPGDGVWLVSEFTRALTRTRATVKLVRGRPVLPEPPPQGDPEAGEAGEPDLVPTGGAGGGYGRVAAGRYGGVSLTGEQTGHAHTIAGVARQRDLGDRGALLGIMCALQESSLRNLRGGDRDSAGLFQQRPSQGWGTHAQVTTPTYAAGKFYDALVRVAGWQTLAPTVAIQRVQRSAHPDAYARHEPVARALLDAMARAGGPAPAPSTGGGQAGNPAREAAIRWALGRQGLPYVWGGKGPNSYDCSGFVAAATRHAGKELPGNSKGQHATCRARGVIVPVPTALATRGAVLFRMTGNPTHVALSLGDGRTVEARGRAYGCGVFGGAAGRNWTAGALWL